MTRACARPFRGPAAFLAVLLVLPAAARATRLPEGFSETLVARGFTGATAMEVAPDGRVFICEQTGAVRVVKDGVLLPTPFVTVKVDSSWERGLLGIAFDPRFGQNHFVYLNYTPGKPFPHHRISRFTADGDTAVPGSEKVLFEGDDQRKLGGGVPNGHQGGAIHFGADGKLYVALGDQTAGVPAQRLDTLQGKLLRLNPDGSIPKDNPFYRTAKGKYRAIWALGLRNPFTFAVQQGTGRMFINDVGGANEEVNEGAAGANYGWPTADHGPTRDPRFRGPVYWYKESSITGGAFYNPPRRQFPAGYVGKYFFADFKAGWIKVLDPDRPERPAPVRDFITGFRPWAVVDLKVAPDGSLYYLCRNAWVRDDNFHPTTGALYRVRYTGSRTPPHIAAPPAHQAVRAGGSGRFEVRATGSGTLRYQWQRDGQRLPGRTGSVLVVGPATRADGGARFRCVVTNPFGTAVSEPATLTVLEAADANGLALRPDPGTYTGPITVRLDAGKSGAVVRYTTDGSGPTLQSPAYRRPFQLDHSATVKARAFRDGKPLGKEVAAAYRVEGTAPYGLPDRPPAATLKMPLSPQDLPKQLSQTGVFASLADLKPSPGIIPYDVNSPLWSDGAFKRRWIALPVGARIGFTETGEWSFPAGTVFIKHFELATDETNPKARKRLETRLLVVDETGMGYGVTYRWRPDNRDADLLTDVQTEDVSVKTARDRRVQQWYYPSRADCLDCHTGAAGFVLGVKTRQLNGPFTYPDTGVTDNQIRTWGYLGMFRQRPAESRIPALRRLVRVTDRRASREQRARSYLDANCAGCHRPGNTLRATFDARFDTPVDRQGLVGAPTVSDSLGRAHPRLIAPGDADGSMVYRRMLRADTYQMPPLAVHVKDRDALSAIRRWINGLAPAKNGTR